jgi:predicted O-methyltransferase YrrM
MQAVARAFPETALQVTGPNERTVSSFAESGCSRYAEIGVYEGDTALGIAEVLGGRGELHLFDFEDRTRAVAQRLRAAGHANVVEHPNTRRLLDSYNWSLMQVLRTSDGPAFDYVFLDGAHTWTHDALAFLLLDRLLEPGGYVDFDDYIWTLRDSPSMNPQAFPEVRRLYSDEQIAERQVQLVVELLVRGHGYEEVVANRVFRKAS